MTTAIALIADTLVAILLVATIATCVVLSRRIARLKADEATMRRTISELVTATETAERAIGGLRLTIDDCDKTLADKLKMAEQYSTDLSVRVEAGEAVMSRIGQIVEASQMLAKKQSAHEPMPMVPEGEMSEVTTRLSKTASIAQNLVERAVRRLEGNAA